MSEKRGHWSGLIIVCLVLTSWPFLSNAAICMAEIPGTLMTFVTFLFYLKAIRHQKPYLFVCAGILMAFTLFTKWHHGVFVIGAVVFTQLTDTKKILCHTNYYLFIPFFILMAGWFIHPQHILSFYGHSTFQPHYYEFFSLENWIFYPNSFFRVYNRSSVIAVVIGISFLLCLKKIKDPKIRLFAAHIFIGIILLTIKLDNRHRYIITIVPSIWILGSYQLLEYIYYVKNRLNNRTVQVAFASIIITGFSVMLFSSATSLYKIYPESLLKIKYWSDEKPNKAYGYITKNVANHNWIAVFGSWDYYNSLKGPTIKWHLEVNRANDLNKEKDDKKKSFYYFREVLKRKDRESYQAFTDFIVNKNTNVAEYHLLSFMKVLNLDAYRDYRKNNKINPFSDKISDVNSISDNITCFITIANEKEKELNYFTQQFFSEQKHWSEFNSESFPDLGIKITIYERKGDQQSILNF